MVKSILKKAARIAAGAAILGTGQYLGDLLYYKLVHPKLPEKFINWFAMNAFRANSYRYGVSAAVALVLVPVAAKVIGLGRSSPIKDSAAK